MCELLACHSAEWSDSQCYHGNSRKKTINKMVLLLFLFFFFFLFLFLLFRQNILPVKYTLPDTSPRMHTREKNVGVSTRNAGYFY